MIIIHPDQGKKGNLPDYGREFFSGRSKAMHNLHRDFGIWYSPEHGRQLELDEYLRSSLTAFHLKS
jgi:hypothetical protein